MSGLKVFRKDDDNDELEQKYGGGAGSKKGKKSKEASDSSTYASALNENSDPSHKNVFQEAILL